MFSRMKVAAVLLAATASTLGVQAHADGVADDVNVQTQIVSLRGLDLGVTAEQQRLKFRLARAARKVCSESDGSERESSAGFASCYQEALSAALKQADARIAAAQSRTLFATATQPR